MDKKKYIRANYPNSLFIYGYDDAVIGVSLNGNVIYDYTKMVDMVLSVNRGMVRGEAEHLVNCAAELDITDPNGIPPIIMHMLH